jgi:GTPase SAR1 family protein
MLVYDMTSRSSFENMKRWLKQIKDNAHRNIAVSLIANKCDRADERVVSTAEGLAFAEAHGMDFVETSAALAVNVETAFRRLIMAVARLLPEGKRSCSSAGSCSGAATPHALRTAAPSRGGGDTGGDSCGEEEERSAAAVTDADSSTTNGASVNGSSSSSNNSAATAADSSAEQQQQQQQQQLESPHTPVDLAEPPPEGWVRVESKARDGCWSYENIWTGERVSKRPLAPAIEYNTIQARALTHSVDVTGIGLHEPDRLANPVGITCGNLSGNCTVC